MLIPILNREHYVQAIPKPRAAGWNPTTHLAKLHIPAVGPVNSWVKIDSQLKPFLGNEVIGWIVAKALGIPCPEHAAILVEDVAWFRDQLGINYPDDGFFPSSGDVAAWCTSDLGAGPIKSVAGLDEMNLLSFLRTEDGAQIAAMDHWLANEDRNTGNIIRLGQGKYAAIDHGILFCYLDWRASEINPPAKSFLHSMSGNLAKTGKLAFKDWRLLMAGMVEFGYRHEGAAKQSQDDIRENIKQIENDTAAGNVLRCIASRSKREWIAEQLGMIV